MNTERIRSVALTIAQSFVVWVIVEIHVHNAALESARQLSRVKGEASVLNSYCCLWRGVRIEIALRFQLELQT
jgi:hypothetical protein